MGSSGGVSKLFSSSITSGLLPLLARVPLLFALALSRRDIPDAIAPNERVLGDPGRLPGEGDVSARSVLIVVIG